VGGEVLFEEFKSMCSKCSEEGYRFLTIDNTRKKNNGKFRNKIKEFIKTA
jgi:hypothetical protein